MFSSGVIPIQRFRATFGSPCIMYKLELVIKNSYPIPILLLDGFGYWLYDSICRPVKDVYNAAYASYEVPYSESARHMQMHNN